MPTGPVQVRRIDPKFTPFKLSIRRSKIQGHGVYAGELIPPRRKVIEYTGERINRKETKRRDVGPFTYLFTLDDYWTLDGSVGGSGAELINHCCEPNLISRIVKGHILYLSLREIEPGEELTVDYHFSPTTGHDVCKCGAAKCRGVMQVVLKKKV
jgi:SET domain-containing protein